MDSVSLKMIQRFADHSKRWMMAYINGLSKDQRKFAEKQYKSYRTDFCVDELDHCVSLVFSNGV
jgi:hypothetical protein